MPRLFVNDKELAYDEEDSWDAKAMRTLPNTASRLASTEIRVEWPLYAPCPGCGDPFRHAASPSAPVTLAPCGHTMCAACVGMLAHHEAVVGGPAKCTVCQGVFTAHAVNHALAEWSEGVWVPDDSCEASIPATDSATGNVCCNTHPGEARTQYCCDTQTAVCRLCDAGPHAGHAHLPLTPPEDALPYIQTGVPQFKFGAVEAALAGVAQARAQLVATRDSTCKDFNDIIDRIVAGVRAHAEHVTGRVHAVCRERLKALDAQADELRVTCEQMRTYAAMCSADALARHCNDVASMVRLVDAVAAARQLCARVPELIRAPPAACTWIGVAVVDTLEASVIKKLQKRTALHQERCELHGDGVTGYWPDRRYQKVCLSGRPQTDVVVVVTGRNAKQERLKIRAQFSHSQMYTFIFPSGKPLPVGDIEVYVMMQGCEVAGSRVSVPPWLPLADTLTQSGATGASGCLLARVGAGACDAFLCELTTNWLQARGDEYWVAVLLYRGSRDGLSPAAFHRRCDGKWPTVTLIRSANGYTFGGYASRAWETPHSTEQLVEAPGSFLFSVEGPKGGCTFFPLRRGYAGGALKLGQGLGPTFVDGFQVWGVRDPDPTRGHSSSCSLGTAGCVFEDTLGGGPATFTGCATFAVEDVEVFALMLVEPEVGLEVSADED